MHCYKVNRSKRGKIQTILTMITREMLNHYRKAKINETKHRKPKRQPLLYQPYWALIETLLLFVKLVNGGLNHDAIVLTLHIKLAQHCEDDYTIRWLKDIAIYGYNTTKPKPRQVARATLQHGGNA